MSTRHELLFAVALATSACGAPPAETVAGPLEWIAGYTPGARDAVVYWWSLTPGARGTYAATGMQSMSVPF